MASNYRDDVWENREKLLTGRVLAIDPASGASSFVGYAYFEAGVLIESGIVMVERSSFIQHRLRELVKSLYNKFKDRFPDVLIIERIRSGKNQSPDDSYFVHVSLLWSVGAILAAIPSDVVLECPVATWRSFTAEGYQKSDEQDAISIGTATLTLAAKQR